MSVKLAKVANPQIHAAALGQELSNPFHQAMISLLEVESFGEPRVLHSEFYTQSFTLRVLHSEFYIVFVQNAVTDYCCSRGEKRQDQVDYYLELSLGILILADSGF